ncbi:hypothetical protein ACOZ4I_11200 [Haloarcula salina]|uniref:hypothetical protein n=1 Tax=Haloarcula salina TaxID=1429914 RepID=UPI003C6F2947
MIVPEPIRDDWGIALLTALSVAALIASSLVGAPGAYAYNEYVGEGGDTQTRDDGTAMAGAGGAMATGGGALIAAGEYAGASAAVYAGAGVATGGTALALAGGALVA